MQPESQRTKDAATVPAAIIGSGKCCGAEWNKTAMHQQLLRPVVPTPGAPIASGDVYRLLHFYSPPPNHEAPVFRVTEANGVGHKNYPCLECRVLIRDVRHHYDSRHRPIPFILASHGFQLLRNVRRPTSAEAHDAAAPSSASMDEEGMKKLYGDAAVRQIFEHVPGAQKVIVFDQTVRRAAATTLLNRPVRKVHIDQTPQAAMLRAKRHLDPKDSAAVESGALRLRIINVWRPLSGPVSDHPLCMAESMSVPEDDLVAVDHVYHDRIGQTYAVRFRPPALGAEQSHRFWYFSNMEVTDVWLIQCFDSKRDGCNRRVRCPHASFELFESPGTGNAEGMQRESIEVRCLVLGGDAKT